MFRPCIDLHEGMVKQIVGGTLGDDSMLTNFVSERSSRWFAERYRLDQLTGGHVIMLGPGNEAAALDALHAYPGGLQVGGGIRSDNAQNFLEAGASHVIVASWVFREGRIDFNRLAEISKTVGKKRLVLDLSCRRKDDRYTIVTDRWQKWTTVDINPASLAQLSDYCDEFLIHAVDVEGRCQGIDQELVKKLGQWTPLPTTYAGGANSVEDLTLVTDLGQGLVDLTIGSALDIFGGTGVRYADAVAFNKQAAQSHSPPEVT